MSFVTSSQGGDAKTIYRGKFDGAWHRKTQEGPLCNFFAGGVTWGVTLVTPPILTLRLHRNNVDLHVNSTNKVTVRIRKVKVKVMIKVKVKFKQRTFFLCAVGILFLSELLE